MQNLIAVLADGPDADRACDGWLCALQIEGTGAGPGDVVIDAGFAKEHVVRADRADGVYLRNFTAQRAGFTGVYVIETDGFAIDGLVGRWTDEYGFLIFASDHGLYSDCEAYGNGDAGIYRGSAADLGGARWAIEVRHCRSHHNTLGYSGTAGNSVWVHDNEFFENSTGAATDSLFPNHPGLPQNSARFERNRIWSNNADYFRYRRDGACDRPSAERGYEEGFVCPLVAAPVGTGLLIAGGNHNVVTDDWIGTTGGPAPCCSGHRHRRGGSSTVPSSSTRRAASPSATEWIANDRKARSLLAEMRAVAAEAAVVILAGDDG